MLTELKSKKSERLEKQNPKIQLHKQNHKEGNKIKYVCVSRNYSIENFDRRVIYCIAAEKQDFKKKSLFFLPILAIYRFFEFALSFIVLLLTAPITFIIILIIRLDSPGRAIFIQKRVSKSILVKGKDLLKMENCFIEDPDFSSEKLYWFPQTFNFVKIRTMYSDARERFPDLYAYDYSKEEIDTFAFKVPNDPRVTRAGKWLRESTLDEILNFWNVINGHINLVGPRPEIPEMLAYYKPIEMLKFTVKPGVTGLPQTKGRGRLSFERTKSLDLQYVMTNSLFMDIKIIFVTIWKVITRHGSF